MTLVQFFINFLKPYADLPEFTTCIIRAMKELGHGVAKESFYEEAINSCRIVGKEAHTMIVDDSCDE